MLGRAARGAPYAAMAERLPGLVWDARLSVTSGTTGGRGIFVMDDRTMAVATALTVRMLRAWLGVGDVLRIVAGGGRMAMVNTTGGHFASAVAAARLRKRRLRRRAIGVFPVKTPLPELVAQLNRFRPAIVAGYAMLTFSADSGERVTLAPLVFTTLADRTPGIELFQWVQTDGTTLRLRFRPAASAEPEHVRKALHAQVDELLTAHGLHGITVEVADEEPEPTTGGKYRSVIPPE